jgi:hypothetical protein
MPAPRQRAVSRPYAATIRRPGGARTHLRHSSLDESQGRRLRETASGRSLDSVLEALQGEGGGESASSSHAG